MANDQSTKLSQADLLAHLDGQMRALSRACDAYDAGDLYAASDIARIVRLLLHDTKHGKSLFGQTGNLNRPFYDSIPVMPLPPGAVSPLVPGLAVMEFSDSGIRFMPIADIAGVSTRSLPFKVWWEPKVVHASGFSWSRRDLILTMADKAGGAHVDPDIPTHYYAISTGIGTNYSIDGQALPDLEKACVRQIATEVQKSLKR